MLRDGSICVGQDVTAALGSSNGDGARRQLARAAAVLARHALEYGSSFDRVAAQQEGPDDGGEAVASSHATLLLRLARETEPSPACDARKLRSLDVAKWLQLPPAEQARLGAVLAEACVRSAVGAPARVPAAPGGGGDDEVEEVARPTRDSASLHCRASSSGGAQMDRIDRRAAAAARDGEMIVIDSDTEDAPAAARTAADGADGAALYDPNDAAAAAAHDPERRAAADLTMRDRIVAIYTRHNPAMLSKVDSLLAKYADQQEQLLSAIIAKYADSGEVVADRRAPAGEPTASARGGGGGHDTALAFKGNSAHPPESTRAAAQRSRQPRDASDASTSALSANMARASGRAEQVNPAAIMTALRSELGGVDPYDRRITPRVLRVAVEKRLGSVDLSDRKNFIVEAIRTILAEMYAPVPHAAS